jgi:acyl-CoA thioester hydrolase
MTADDAGGRVADRRGDYRHFLAIPTRWKDNDIYGHVNNVVYYSYFDTVVNHYLVTAGGLDIHEGPVIGLAVESFCRFHQPLAFPDAIDAGLRVGRLGRSSVRYEIGIFRAGEEAPSANGHFVHVFVDRQARRPVPIPPPLRTALERLLMGAAGD